MPPMEGSRDSGVTALGGGDTAITHMPEWWFEEFAAHDATVPVKPLRFAELAEYAEYAEVAEPAAVATDEAPLPAPVAMFPRPQVVFPVPSESALDEGRTVRPRFAVRRRTPALRFLMVSSAGVVAAALVLLAVQVRSSAEPGPRRPLFAAPTVTSLRPMAVPTMVAGDTPAMAADALLGPEPIDAAGIQWLLEKNALGCAPITGELSYTTVSFRISSYRKVLVADFEGGEQELRTCVEDMLRDYEFPESEIGEHIEAKIPTTL